jgi:cyclopropane fatty-acyl-phospholipid synthase-like methyltransferase
MASKNEISQYYDDCYTDYNESWSGEHLHMGMWDESVDNHEKSLVNTINETMKHLTINKDDAVLDLGCGTGGTCRLIASETGARVTGIMNSKVLYEQALEKNKKLDRINFILGDYLNSGLKNNSYDKIIAIESVCYCTDLNRLFSELYRILKPGGKFAISDFFLSNNTSEEDHNRMMEDWLSSWKMPYLFKIDTFINEIKDNGFKNTEFINKTKAVEKSSNLMADNINKMLPQILAGCARGEFPEARVVNITAGVKMNEFLKQGLWEYGILTAEKPEV